MSEKGQGSEGIPVGTGTVLAGPEGSPGGAGTATPPPPKSDGRAYSGSDATDAGSKPAGGSGGGASAKADQTPPGFHYDEKSGMYWSGDPGDPNSVPFEIQGNKPTPKSHAPAAPAAPAEPPGPGDSMPWSPGENIPPERSTQAPAPPRSETPATPPPPEPLDEDDFGGPDEPPGARPDSGSGGPRGPHGSPGPDDGATQIDPPSLNLEGPNTGSRPSVLDEMKPGENKPVIS